MSTDETLIDFAQQLGGVSAQLEHLTTEVSGLRSDAAELKDRMRGVEDQVKIANGRTSRLERKLEQLFERLGLLEQWRRTVTFLPRVLDRWAERPFWALPLSAAIGSATTFAVVRLLGG